MSYQWLIETSIFRLNRLIEDNGAKIVRALSMSSDLMVFQLDRQFEHYKTKSLLEDQTTGVYTIISYQINGDIATIRIQTFKGEGYHGLREPSHPRAIERNRESLP